jgi:hypothetical protein
MLAVLVLCVIFISVASIRFVSHRILNIALKSGDVAPSSPVTSEMRRVTLSLVQTVGILATVPALAGAKVSGTYLSQPTSEFKDELTKVAEFNKKQKLIRDKWESYLVAIESTEEPVELVKNLQGMRKIIDDLNGIPVGVTKRAFVKRCHAKKFTGKKRNTFWNKDVEIAYEALIQEYNKETNPDTTTRDTGEEK